MTQGAGRGAKVQQARAQGGVRGGRTNPPAEPGVPLDACAHAQCTIIHVDRPPVQRDGATIDLRMFIVCLFALLINNN